MDYYITPETWVPVRGFEGYEVSSLGRVRSLRRVTMRSNGSPHTVKGRIRKLTVQPNGYNYVTFRRDGKTYCRQVHRIVLDSFRPAPAEGLDVRHLNNVRTDNRLENLTWGTRSENERDKAAHGTDHNLNKDHCPRGHAYIPENLVPSKARHGHRNCLACSRGFSYLKRHPEMRDQAQKITDSYYEALLPR